MPDRNKIVQGNAANLQAACPPLLEARL